MGNEQLGSERSVRLGWSERRTIQRKRKPNADGEGGEGIGCVCARCEWGRCITSSADWGGPRTHSLPIPLYNIHFLMKKEGTSQGLRRAGGPGAILFVSHIDQRMRTWRRFFFRKNKRLTTNSGPLPLLTNCSSPVHQFAVPH